MEGKDRTSAPAILSACRWPVVLACTATTFPARSAGVEIPVVPSRTAITCPAS